MDGSVQGWLCGRVAHDMVQGREPPHGHGPDLGRIRFQANVRHHGGNIPGTVIQFPAQLGRRPSAMAYVGAQDGAGVFQVFQGLFLLQMKLDAQFILRADESGEDELVAFYGPSLEDGHGVKGFRYFRMAGYVPHIYAGGMIQNMADDKFLLRPAQEDDGMMESGAIQVGGGNQKVPRQVFIADIFVFHHGHKSTLPNVTDAGNHAFKRPCQEAVKTEHRKNRREGELLPECIAGPSGGTDGGS